LHPLTRTGSWGADQWDRITWADALDEVARQVRCTRENRRVIDRGSVFELEGASEGKGLVGELRSS
jgi:anaerobic selenocysteine-containing dehydrogenase